MKLIYRTLFGSHIYGTNLPTSDTDFKSIFIPDAKDIILERAPKYIQKNTKVDKNSRNTSDDVDDESFSISQYLKLLCEGQTVSLDMLFAPKEFHTISTPEWEFIKSNKDYFLHKGTTAFIGYTRQQAAKYGVKGFRVAALKSVIDFLNEASREYDKLMDYDIHLWVAQQNSEFIKVVDVKGPKGLLEPHLEVCNRKVPFHATLKYAKEIFNRIYENYGDRARQAERNEGVDWKALMHAVRVAREAEELLLTGNITFPRPEKDLLLKIRKGEMAYKEVEVLIEEGLHKIDETCLKSILPSKPDYKKVEEIIHEFHSNILKDYLRTL